jgi:hypothetical protein
MSIQNANAMLKNAMQCNGFDEKCANITHVQMQERICTAHGLARLAFSVASYVIASQEEMADATGFSVE